MLSEMAYWLMIAGAVLVGSGLSPLHLATTPPNAPCRQRKTARATNIIEPEAKTTVPPSSATRPPRHWPKLLKQCGNDLSRENVMKQAAALKDYQGSVLLPGIKISTGPSNFRPIKHLRLLQFDGRTWHQCPKAAVSGQTIRSHGCARGISVG